MSPAKSVPFNRDRVKAAIDRLDAQLKSLRKDASEFAKREEEWTDLESLLKDLPGKLRHPIMVPFGQMAFFPGYIEHTNEVLTQLSTEWFTMRTTDQALGMVDRRVSRVRAQKAELDQKVRQLEMTMGVAVSEESNVGVTGATVSATEDGFLDIREPYNEADDDKSKAPLPCSSSKASAEPVEKDVMARLRELEKMEDMDELDSLMEQAEAGSLALPSLSHGAEAPLCAASAEASAAFNTPADIFDRMQTIEEHASPDQRQRAVMAQGATAARIGTSAASAEAMPERETVLAPTQTFGRESGFSTVVRERVGAPTTGKPAASQQESKEADAPPKRVSKFKAERSRGT